MGNSLLVIESLPMLMCGMKNQISWITSVREDASLEVACPVCEAAPQERCHVQAGVIRAESHFERIELASELGDERPAETRPHTLLASRRNRRRLDKS
jgi:hypothetical protein